MSSKVTAFRMCTLVYQVANRAAPPAMNSLRLDIGLGDYERDTYDRGTGKTSFGKYEIPSGATGLGMAR